MTHLNYQTSPKSQGKASNYSYKKNTTSSKQGNPKQPKKEKINACNVWIDWMTNGKNGLYASEKFNNITTIREWKDGYWQEMTSEDGKAFAYQWLKQNYPAYARPNTANDCWRTTELFLRTVNPLPEVEPKKDMVILPFKNCYLKIDKNTITKIKPNPKYGMRFAVPCEYKETTEEDKLKQDKGESLFYNFLNSSIPDKQTQKLIQEQCALTFIQGQRNEVASWWYGPGRAGKGTMIKIMSRFHSNPEAISLHKLNDTHALFQLTKASVILVDEVAKKRWDEETWKSLVSGDFVSINPKHKDGFSFRCKATWMITSNNPPFITDDTTGTRRRIIPVEWTNAIPEKDKIIDLEEKIFNQEAHIVVSWLIQGIQRILTRDGLIMPLEERPEAVKRAIRDMTTNNDSIASWVEADQVVYKENHYQTKDAVYNAYEAFCEEDQRQPVAPNTFWKLLFNRQDCKSIKNSSCRKTLNGKRAYCVEIEWTSQDDDIKAYREKVRAGEIKPSPDTLEGDFESLVM